ncbi:tRNA pseudouridine(55) synthase TruB [Haliovirga abyssi]|uniref:tRNA pseudouridine synthase B n=1 Tax=Haliovirga abyssi TaxID=2996794 RepID=A0AAU9DEM0_9FUSO|nr:tRNA pseudouridine(55) synthase TruB [Haliovirga abyssi]BDU50807.1 tRNA pseudouridine synthase B [Haliovirga abyssi]
MIGIINVNKPKGITSFDVIRKLRKLLNEKKIGHTGTLDPLATGVLVVCVGKATKLVSDIEAKEKVYRAEFELGYATDTYDTEGKIIKKVDNFEIKKEKLEKVLSEFVGEQLQVPPMYSAIKINGKKLYELARQNIEVEREARKIKIDYIKLLKFEDKKVMIETKVSKGTYIRTLIYDIGEKLGCYGTMTELQRSSVGEYLVENSFTLSKIEDMALYNDFGFVVDVEEAFSEFENLTLENETELKLFKNGNTVVKEDWNNNKYRVYFEDKFIGLGRIIDFRLKGYKYF